MRRRATLQGRVGYSLRAGQNPFTGRMLHAPALIPLHGQHKYNILHRQHSNAKNMFFKDFTKYGKKSDKSSTGNQDRLFVRIFCIVESHHFVSIRSANPKPVFLKPSPRSL